MFFQTGNFRGFSIEGSSEVAMGGGGARSAQLCVSMSLKRRMRAAHGCVAQPKPTSNILGAQFGISM
jgi:hypothetical protein